MPHIITDASTDREAANRIDGAVTDLKHADGLADARRAALHELLDLEKSMGRLAVRARLATGLVDDAGLANGSVTTLESVTARMTEHVDWLRGEIDTVAKAYVKALRDPERRS